MPYGSRLDNTQWMRNGDYAPSRLDRQNEVALLYFNRTRASNVENSVALISAGRSGSSAAARCGDTVQVLLKPSGRAFKTTLVAKDRALVVSP